MSGDDQWPAAENYYNPYLSYDHQPSYLNMNPYDSSSYNNYPTSYYPCDMAAAGTSTVPSPNNITTINSSFYSSPVSNYNSEFSYDQQQSYLNTNPYDSTCNYTSFPPTSYHPIPSGISTIPAATTNATTINSSFSGSSPKQKKRQSRTSSKADTPDIFVHAQDASDFKSIVQRLTGCPSTDSPNSRSEDYYGANSRR